MAKAIELAIDIKLLVKKFPNEELFQLTSQIRRSSKSISSNIAESTGRTTKKDKARFITFAYSSGLETVDHLIFSFKCGYITFEELAILKERYRELLNKINSYNKTLIG
jgi:four helix bundle protein